MRKFKSNEEKRGKFIMLLGKHDVNEIEIREINIDNDERRVILEENLEIVFEEYKRNDKGDMAVYFEILNLTDRDCRFKMSNLRVNLNKYKTKDIDVVVKRHYKKMCRFLIRGFEDESVDMIELETKVKKRGGKKYYIDIVAKF